MQHIARMGLGGGQGGYGRTVCKLEFDLSRTIVLVSQYVCISYPYPACAVNIH